MANPRKKILITGGAGNLGRETTRILVGRGFNLRLFDLPDMDFSLADKYAHVEAFVGDLRDSPALEKACREVDGVIHLAALMPPLSETDRDLAKAINVEGTRNLLSAIPEGIPLVFASSVATYGLTQSEVVTVDHPQKPIDYYGESKLINEEDIRSSRKPFVILRITGISIPALLELPRPWFFTSDQRMEFIHLRDAALAVSNSLEIKEVLGGTWLIAGGKSWRMHGQQYSEAICRAFEIPPDFAVFHDTPNWPAWYDTIASQERLNYQQHTFDQFIAQLGDIYQKAISSS